MKLHHKGIPIEIPDPPENLIHKDHKGYKVVAYRPAKKGEMIYSIVNKTIYMRENESSGCFWILEEKTAEKNVKTEKATSSEQNEVSKEDFEKETFLKIWEKEKKDEETK